MKTNPLFQDSSLSQGSNVHTIFELNEVEILDNQSICLKVTFGNESKNVEMLLKDKSCFEARVWLPHRSELSYQFYIMEGAEVISASEEKLRVALHLVTEIWNPDENFNLEQAESLQDQNLVKSEPGANEAREDEDFIGNLIKKWGL